MLVVGRFAAAGSKVVGLGCPGFQARRCSGLIEGQYNPYIIYPLYSLINKPLYNPNGL